MFQRFSRWVVALRWVVLVAWVAAAAGAWLFLPDISGGGSGPFGGAVPANAAPLQVQRQAISEFGLPVLSRTSVVLRDPHGLSAAAQLHVVAVAAGSLGGRRPGFPRIAAAVPVTNAAGLFPSAHEQGTTAVTYLFFRPGTDVGERAADAHRYADTFFSRPPGGTLGVTGPFAAEQAQAQLTRQALFSVEIGTVLMVVLVVGLRFRSVVAPVVTLLAAGISYLVATHLLGWLGQRFPIGVPGALEPLLVVLLIGVVTDYAVFLLAGFRQHLSTGQAPRDAIRAAGTEIIPIVATAALAVAAGTASLVVAQLSLFRRLGPGMAITVLVTMAVAVTFIPALLAVLGRRALWPSRLARQAEPHGTPGKAGRAPGTLRRALLRRIVRRPVAATLLLLGSGVLVVAALPLAHFQLGTNLIADLPGSSSAARSLDAAAAGFAPGIVAPTELVLSGPGIAERRSALVHLQHRLAAQPGVAGVIGPAQQPLPAKVGAVYAPSGDAARYLLILSDKPYGARAADAVANLQRGLPKLQDEVGLSSAQAGWSGDPPLSEVVVRISRADLLRVGLVALAALFLILVIFLRSLLAPVLLLAASALAVAATLGITLWLFPHLTGETGPTFYLPIAVAVLLLSFGSDYNIYLVGRIWEESRDHPLREAIVTGGPGASRAIGGAGLALSASFAMLALVPLAVFRELAFAMVVGILLDTFFVRAYLVPAGLALLGPWASWPSRRHRDQRRHQDQRRHRDTKPAGDGG